MPVVITKRMRADVPEIVLREKTDALLDIGNVMRGVARKNAPRRTGRLQDNIKRSGVEPSPTAKTIFVRIFIAPGGLPYGEYQHEGTGLFGPKKRRIYPRTAKVLAWPTRAGAIINLARRVRPGKVSKRGTANMAFAASVAGVKPSKFIEKAAKDPEVERYYKSRMTEMMHRIEKQMSSKG